MKTAFELAAVPLGQLDPIYAGLRMAKQIITSAFPLDTKMPADMETTLTKMD